MRPSSESGRARRLVCLLSFACCVGVVQACGPRRVTLPTDAGTPFPDFAQVHQMLSAACRGVRTLTAELALAGRAGPDRLRGRVQAGFTRPSAMRLEGVAPFGPPAFILVARERTATLVLPRESGVLRGAQADEILGALVGVALGPADVLAILTGCVVPDPKPAAGRLHQGGWASISLMDGAELFLRRPAATWQIRAARRNGWQIEYPDWNGQFPPVVRLISDAQAVAVDVTASLSQIQANTDLDAAALTAVDIPSDARPVTLEQLRAAGPLRDAESKDSALRGKP
jgi:outer membrane biogenesis lipoprotein LolB